MGGQRLVGQEQSPADDLPTSPETSTHLYLLPLFPPPFFASILQSGMCVTGRQFLLSHSRPNVFCSKSITQNCFLLKTYHTKLCSAQNLSHKTVCSQHKTVFCSKPMKQTQAQHKSTNTGQHMGGFIRVATDLVNIGYTKDQTLDQWQTPPRRHLKGCQS